MLLPAITRIQPRLTVYAALGCTLTQIAAIIFHFARGEVVAAPLNIVLLALSVFIIWGRGKQGADCASLIETNEPRACGTARGPRRLGCPCRASNEQIVCGSYSTLPRSRRYDRTASVRTPANVRLLGSAVAEGCHRGWPATIEQPAPSSDF